MDYSPGPWKATGKTIKSIFHQRYYTVARADNPLFTPEANAANARLIAAAPDLLAKCGMALDVLLADGYGETSHAVMQLRSAIQKATTNKP